jgi:radical SAM-linked protein
MHWTKIGKLRWTSHRDAARMWERALRRAELTVAYSQGFSPRPRVSFGLALPTGSESLAEYLDVDLAEPVGDLARLPALVSATLPVGMDVVSVAAVGSGAESLQAAVVACRWEIDVDGIDEPRARVAVSHLLESSSAVVVRRRKSGEGPDDIRPGIVDLTVRGASADGSGVTLEAVLGTKPRGVRPGDLIAAAFPGMTERRSLRLEQFIECDGRLVPLTVTSKNMTSTNMTSKNMTSKNAAPLAGASL